MSNEQRQTILFLHGAWHGAWCWKKYFVPYFTKAGYDCHTFNLRGHSSSGKTSGINKHSLLDYVDDLTAAVDKLDRSPVIVAHSMGGMVLQKYLEDHSCSKAILMTPVPPQGVFRVTTYFLLNKWYAWPSLLGLNLFGLVSNSKRAKWAFFSNNIDENELAKYASKLCSESFKAFLDMLSPRVKVNNHAKIPMLVLGANDDNIFTPKECESTASKYKADLIMLDDIAHDMMLDTNYETAAQTILHWIERN